MSEDHSPDFSAYQTITFERIGLVLKVTLNRPEKLNAVNGRMHLELTTAFTDADRDPDTNVIVVTGAGRAFCAGGDVSAFGTPSGVAHPDDEIHSEGRRIVDNMLWVQKPMIAMVNGPASGLGSTLALFCDVVFAATEATISDRHVNVGLVAGDGGAVVWPLLVGIAKAKEALMTGRLIKGSEAERIGLVNYAVPLEELEARTMAFANDLAILPTFAVRATKMSINRQLRRAVEDVLDLSFAFERMSFKHPDHRAAVQRFLDSRKP